MFYHENNVIEMFLALAVWRHVFSAVGTCL
jgi:hypothetical protein